MVCFYSRVQRERRLSPRLLRLLVLISRNIELIEPEFLPSPKLLRRLVLISRKRELIPPEERLPLRAIGIYSGAEARRPLRLVR